MEPEVMRRSDFSSMYYNARPHRLEKAKQLRENMAELELRLWESLKNRKVCGLRFRPQHPVGDFIVDFYCHLLKLVVSVRDEVNESHQNELEAEKQRRLEEWEIKEVCFSKDEIEGRLDYVVDQLKVICKKRRAELYHQMQARN